MCGLGDPHEVIGLFARLRAGGEIPDGSLLELPRVDLAALTEHFDVDRHEHWSILWTRETPEPADDDRLVTQLSTSDYQAINALLDAAFPATHNRPGRPGIHRWFGIRESTDQLTAGGAQLTVGGGDLVAVGAGRTAREGGNLVAVGADRTAREGGNLVAVGADRSVNGVGYLAAVAVEPSRQGHGYGAAVTRRLVRELLAESDLCALGVVAANERARRLYRRMGFTEGIDLTSVTLRLPQGRDQAQDEQE